MSGGKRESVSSRRRMGTMAVAVVLCACGGRDQGSGGVSRADSAGVEVVTSSAPAWSAGEAWRIGEAQVVLGGEDVQLFEVAGAVRRPDGHFVVADGGNARILFFDAQGRLEASVGGEGDGPGEYRIIQSLGLAGGDSTWVYDFSHRRITLYDGRGVLGRTAALGISLNAAALAGWSGEGFVATQLWGDGDGGALAPGLTRDPVAFVSLDASGMLRDTVGMFPGREVLLRPEGRRMTMGVAPFARGVSYDVGRGRVAIGDQSTHEVRIYGLGGELRAIRRWAGAPLSIGEAEIDAWKEAQVASAASADRSSVRAYLADVPVPERRPAYGPILLGGAGDLWVGSYAHPSQLPSRWDVFDDQGAWLGTVEMPDGFRPVQVGDDWILGLARDALEVERVELRSLVRAR